MSKTPKTTGGKPGTTPPKSDAEKHLDELLDEGLEESFPASDPPAVVAPRHDSATGDEE